MENTTVPEVKTPFNWSNFYDKHYMKFALVPIIILLIALVYMGIFISHTGDVFNKDVSLTGGTTITVYTDKAYSADFIESALKGKFNDISVRILNDVSSGKQVAFTIETKSDANNTKKAVEDFLGYELDEKNSSIEFTGTALSQSFSKELVFALLLAFVFMSIVIFILFKNLLPSSYMIFCAFADITIPLAIVNLMGLKISTAGIAAFLMLVGYSVDSDILLTTRVLKRRDDTLNKRIFGSIKTGLTMTLTSFFAVLIAYFVVIAPSLKQVFLILSIGLFTDIVVTWTVNAGLLKWYCQKRGIQ
jgi:preprotein translocase subunit SecF